MIEKVTEGNIRPGSYILIPDHTAGSRMLFPLSTPIARPHLAAQSHQPDARPALALPNSFSLHAFFFFYCMCLWGVPICSDYPTTRPYCPYALNMEVRDCNDKGLGWRQKGLLVQGGEGRKKKTKRCDAYFQHTVPGMGRLVWIRRY